MNYPVKQAIVIRRDLKMRQGKSVSQGSHASGDFMREQLLRHLAGLPIELTEAEIAWLRGGTAKITTRVESRDEIHAILDAAHRDGLKVSVAYERTEYDEEGAVAVESKDEFDAIADAARAKGLKVKVITDAGHTEFGGVPTITALAIGPDRVEAIDPITGSLKLL